MYEKTKEQMVQTVKAYKKTVQEREREINEIYWLLNDRNIQTFSNLYLNIFIRKSFFKQQQNPYDMWAFEKPMGFRIIF